MKILTTNTYYVKRKKFFRDNREKDLPQYLHFALVPTDPEYKQNHATDIGKQQDKLDETIQQYQEQSNLLTSCWTVRTMENILMWDRDNKQKACIKSTIGDFVGSFEKDIKYEIWCGRMFYEPFSHIFQFANKIWVKEPCFSDEYEVRFYFSSSDKEVKSDITKECPEKGVSLKVTPTQMMHEVVLSPYIDKKCAETLSDVIKKKYNIEARPSSIDLLNN